MTAVLSLALFACFSCFCSSCFLACSFVVEPLFPLVELHCYQFIARSTRSTRSLMWGGTHWVAAWHGGRRLDGQRQQQLPSPLPSVGQGFDKIQGGGRYIGATGKGNHAMSNNWSETRVVVEYTRVSKGQVRTRVSQQCVQRVKSAGTGLS